MLWNSRLANIVKIRHAALNRNCTYFDVIVILVLVRRYLTTILKALRSTSAALEKPRGQFFETCQSRSADSGFALNLCSTRMAKTLVVLHEL